MRSALICLFFTIVIQRGSWADSDFRPTPIPLNEWNYDRREIRAGTLHETIKTDSPPYVAAVPAHYWEDALRHSVYLTLVRDKIDQLIAKGDVISPDTKPDQHVSKEVDDHDLWEKIKTAPFDRIAEEEPEAIGDVTIMAQGRLMEEKNGYRFNEDERTKEKCSEEKCMEGVKAIWSVKRVRQRDVETSPGKYHYELTFSVISQPKKQQRKPYENPIRTFTVRETSPQRVLDAPKEHRTYAEAPIITQRPQRAIWVHKNIAAMQRHQGRQYSHGLERIFSSLFSDDDDEYVAPHRYRQPMHMPPPGYTQYSKAAYVGSPSDHQKRLTPYPYKPQTYKYSRPSVPMSPYPRPPHHYMEMESSGTNPFGLDNRYIGPYKGTKTTRPPVLPTPLPPKNSTADSNTTTTTTTESIITKAPEIITYHKTYGKPKPIKINYLSDHVRPPVYNAPPGVFVTMDKKPFKPMPPLKLIHSKPLKSYKPTDFRPSPQVLDMHHFSDPSSLHPDNAFRPILPWKHSENSTEKIEVAETNMQFNGTSKATKKPPKKHENIKYDRFTTETPEIITAGHSSSEDDDMDWANIVGAFTKTTPMVSQKEKQEVPESTTTSTTTTTTTTVASTTPKRRTTTTTKTPEATTSTTQKPKKRTRPPPKFSKTSEKFKKHKRITTTSTKAPDTKNTQDLTPLASSAAASKPSWNTTAKAITTTTSASTTTTAKPTTTTRQTTTTQTTTTTPAPKPVFATTQLKIKNRFRQSTLLTKGTSVNHDKWSVTTAQAIEKPRTVIPAEGTFPPRRKGSNFQGYVTSTTQKLLDKNNHKDDHDDFYASTEPINRHGSSSTQHYDDSVDQYESNSDTDYQITHEEDDDEEDENDEQESRDHTEYIFQPSSNSPSDTTNEIIEQEDAVTTEQVITSAFSAPKNKTKCKKKKQNVTTTEELPNESYDITSMTSTTEIPATPSIFEDLFDAISSFDDKKNHSSTSKPEIEVQESQNHGKFAKIDDELQEFLDSLNKADEPRSDNGDYEEDDIDEIEDDGSSYANEDDGPSPRNTSDDFEEYRDRPYSLLELMAME